MGNGDVDKQQENFFGDQNDEQEAPGNPQRAPRAPPAPSSTSNTTSRLSEKQSTVSSAHQRRLADTRGRASHTPSDDYNDDSSSLGRHVPPTSHATSTATGRVAGPASTFNQREKTVHGRGSTTPPVDDSPPPRRYVPPAK